MELIGHKPMLTETNRYGWVWICECGEYGPPVETNPPKGGRGRPKAAATGRAQAAALELHRQHVIAARDDIVARSDAELARIGKLIPLANATLQRRGRFGHP